MSNIWNQEFLLRLTAWTQTWTAASRRFRFSSSNAAVCLNNNGSHIEELRNIHMSEVATSDVDEDLEEEDDFEHDDVVEK